MVTPSGIHYTHPAVGDLVPDTIATVKSSKLQEFLGCLRAELIPLKNQVKTAERQCINGDRKYATLIRLQITYAVKKDLIRLILIELAERESAPHIPTDTALLRAAECLLPADKVQELKELAQVQEAFQE